MKNLIKSIYACITLILMAQLAISQNTKQHRFPGILSESKGEKATYIVIEQTNRKKVFNKANTLMVQESRFEEMLGYGVKNPVKFNDKPKLDSLVYKDIASYFREYKSEKYPDKMIYFDILLYSGLDGIVSEVVFSIENNAKIPFSALEKLESEILFANFKLDFNKESAVIRGSVWVYYWNIYSVEEMKKKLKEQENKN